MVDTMEDVIRFLESEYIEPDPFVFELQTEEWRAGFWNGISSYRRALADYLESNNV